MTVRNRTPRQMPSHTGTLVLGVGGVLVVLAFTFAAWRMIQPGQVGIVFDKAHSQVTNTAKPGWIFINPFTESITAYPVSLQTLTMVQTTTEGKVQGDDSVKIGTTEGQAMNADVSVQYSIPIEQAAQLYTVWAGAPIGTIEDNLIRQVTRAAMNDIASKYGWQAIYGAQRTQYIADVSVIIKDRFAAKNVKFEALNLRGFHLPANLQKAVDTKITAQQAAEQQTYQLEQAKTKAEQDRVQATGQANAVIAHAQGEAQATTVRAKAQAEANKLLAQSLTPDLIRYQQLLRWDGKLPVFNGDGATPLIDGSSMLGGTSATQR